MKYLQEKRNLGLSGVLLFAIILIGGYSSVIISRLYYSTQEMQGKIKTMQKQLVAADTATGASEIYDTMILSTEKIIARSNATTEQAKQGIRFGFSFLVSVVMIAMTIKSLEAVRGAKLRKIKTIETLIKKIENTSGTSVERSFSVKDISSQLQKTVRSGNEMRSQGRRADTALSDTTIKVGTVVEMIHHISVDINLLALNARIEAGHTDKSEKYFSAVATEVKSLANQSKKACEEIETFIQNVQGVSQEVIMALNTTITSVRGISEYTREIASNTQSSQEANISYKQVIDAAQLLSEESEILSQEMQSFLTGIQETS